MVDSPTDAVDATPICNILLGWSLIYGGSSGLLVTQKDGWHRDLDKNIWHKNLKNLNVFPIIIGDRQQISKCIFSPTLTKQGFGQKSWTKASTVALFYLSKNRSLFCLSVQKLTQFRLTIGAGRHSLHYIACLALASSAILAWLEDFRLGHRHSMNFIHALT